MFHEILDLFTRLGHDQMDYSYCYYANYMYMCDLTTKIFIYFLKSLYILPTKTYRLNILKEQCDKQRAAPSHYMEYLFCFIGF